MTKDQIQTFLQAGRAVFTIKSRKTGKHFSYKIVRPVSGAGKHATLFVHLAIGVDDWIYMGVYDPRRETFRLTGKSQFTLAAPSVLALRWFLSNIDSPQVEFRHAGRCGRCGRVLTHPESIDSGMGPECSGRGYSYSRLELQLKGVDVAVARIAEDMMAALPPGAKTLQIHDEISIDFPDQDPTNGESAEWDTIGEPPGNS